MRILVTGGAGYIGSHTCVQLIEAGHQVVVVDNYCNSKPKVFERIEQICGKRPEFIEADIRDREAMDQVFAQNEFDAVIHFAGLKAVGESTQVPLKYYDNNVFGSQVLAETMLKHGVNTLVFSSSATVYGDPHTVPILEDFPVQATNPYGRSKLIVEQMLMDTAKANSQLSIVLLRYFNPVGAHPSGLMGEDPQGIPNNLMPFIAQTAVGKREFLSVFGDDYNTPDGTGVRDYIHVEDLANGHLKALEAHLNEDGVHIYNLGTGNGYSVLDMVKAFSESCGKNVPYKIAERRPGDVAQCYADAALAKEKLGWEATRTLQQMTDDTWRWQSNNPNGYED